LFLINCSNFTVALNIVPIDKFVQIVRIQTMRVLNYFSVIFFEIFGHLV